MKMSVEGVEGGGILKLIIHNTSINALNKTQFITNVFMFYYFSAAGMPSSGNILEKEEHQPKALQKILEMYKICEQKKSQCCDTKTM